jgi:hypothetical protein
MATTVGTRRGRLRRTTGSGGAALPARLNAFGIDPGILYTRPVKHAR